MANNHHQAGVAAIELSLTLMLLLLLIFAIIGYGALFWAKQSMNAVAADTARHVLLESYATPQPELPAVARRYACDAAHSILVLNAFTDMGATRDCDGAIQATLGDMETCTPATSTKPYQCLTIQLEFVVDHWPLMNTMRRLAGLLTAAPGDWVPQRLSTRANILVAPASPSMP